MPSPGPQHEALVRLAKVFPDIIAWALQAIFRLPVPGYDSARMLPGAVTVLIPPGHSAGDVQPSVYAADRALGFYRAGKAVLGAVFEVQRSEDASKKFRWPLFAAQLRDDLRAPVALVAYFPTAALAGWHLRQLADDGFSPPMRLFAVTPADVPVITGEDQAAASPALAALSAIAAGDAGRDVTGHFPALTAGLRAVIRADTDRRHRHARDRGSDPDQDQDQDQDRDRSVDYYDIILAGLPAQYRPAWRLHMTMTQTDRFISDELRGMMRDSKAEGKAEGIAEGEAKGKAEGEAKGKAEAVLSVLDARGLTVPAKVRTEVLACTSLDTLGIFLRRAATAATAADVTAPITAEDTAAANSSPSQP